MEYLANNPKIDVLGTNIYEINKNKIISKKNEIESQRYFKTNF